MYGDICLIISLLTNNNINAFNFWKRHIKNIYKASLAVTVLQLLTLRAATDQLKTGSRGLPLRLQFNKVYCIGTLVQPNSWAEQAILWANIPIPTEIIAVDEEITFKVACGVNIHVLGALQLNGGLEYTTMPVLLIVLLYQVINEML